MIMVDDSIVRGTTCGRLVKLLRDAGAAEVHMRISAPPFRHPCFFGTDIPERNQLLAHNRTVEEMREIIGVDSLRFPVARGLPQDRSRLQAGLLRCMLLRRVPDSGTRAGG